MSDFSERSACHGRCKKYDELYDAAEEYERRQCQIIALDREFRDLRRTASFGERSLQLAQLLQTLYSQQRGVEKLHTQFYSGAIQTCAGPLTARRSCEGDIEVEDSACRRDVEAAEVPITSRVVEDFE